MNPPLIPAMNLDDVDALLSLSLDALEKKEDKDFFVTMVLTSLDDHNEDERQLETHAMHGEKIALPYTREVCSPDELVTVPVIQSKSDETAQDLELFEKKRARSKSSKTTRNIRVCQPRNVS